MGKDSKISWTHHTFNPWWGCARVSPGCENCYAEAFAKRTGKAKWGVSEERRFFGEAHWREPLKWNAAAEKAGERHRVFCASMADVFEDRRDLGAEREKLWALIAATPHLDWLLLTKRPEHAPKMLPDTLTPNLWIGVTVEDQQRAEERIPELLGLPVDVRFLSCEPLLGPLELDLGRCDIHGRDEVQSEGGEEFCNECGANGYSSELSFGHWLDPCASESQPGINWVIVGGESGPGARPFDLAWARSIVSQCREAGVSVFVKQLGKCPTSGTDRITHRGDKATLPQGFSRFLNDSAGRDMSEWPADLRIQEFPR